MSNYSKSFENGDMVKAHSPANDLGNRITIGRDLSSVRMHEKSRLQC